MSFRPSRPSLRSLGLALAGASLIVLLSGCGEEADQAELDLLVNEDPVFHELVRTKENLQAQIAGIQKGLADRKRDMDQKVLTLRQTYEADRQSKEQVINEYEGLLKTQKNDFKAGYEKTTALLESRKRMRADIEKAIREAQGVVAKKDKLAITGKEIGEWEARIENLQNRLGPLDAEISALESLASLKRKKLKYL
jgi:chromosome segregation ATPase